MIIKIIRGLVLGTLLGTIYLSCATEVIKYNPTHLVPDSKLELHRKNIYAISNGRLGTGDYTLGFIKAPKDIPNLLGVCTFTLSNFSKEIDIVDPAWYGLSNARKMILVAHEFKHCECNYYSHTDEVFSDDCSKSIMGEFLPSEMCVKKHFDVYLAEIRRGCED